MHVSRLIRRALEKIREEIAARRGLRRRPRRRRGRAALEPTYNIRHADDRRAARGLPLLLRGEGPHAGIRRGRWSRAPEDRSTLLTTRRHAAADAVLPRREQPPAPLLDDRAEVLPDARHRRGRARRPPPDVLRDARQLLVRPVLQGRRDRVCAWEFVQEQLRLDWDRIWVDRLRRRPGARARRGRGGDRGSGSGSACRRERIVALAALRELLVGRRAGAVRARLGDLLRLGRGARLRRARLRAGLRRCERFLEFWNLVFMEYELARGRTRDAAARSRTSTPAWASSAPPRSSRTSVSVYDTDGYQPIMDWIAGESGVAYGESDARDEGAPHPRRPRPRHDLPRRRRRHAVERGPRLRPAPDHPARRAAGARDRARASSGGSPTSSSSRWGRGIRSSRARGRDRARSCAPRRSGSPRRSSAG